MADVRVEAAAGVKTILSGESVNQHTQNYCLAWMNSARRDLEALNVLTAPSVGRNLFDVPVGEMTDEQLDEALRMIGHPGQQPLLNQCSDEILAHPADADSGPA